ncbi:MAG: hypothetical protein ACKVZH_14660 [Blastocatellia bacterium]
MALAGDEAIGKSVFTAAVLRQSVVLVAASEGLAVAIKLRRFFAAQRRQHTTTNGFTASQKEKIGRLKKNRRASSPEEIIKAACLPGGDS